MRKEVIIAIVLGFALGLVITIGIWSANKAMKTQEETTNSENAQLTSTPAPGNTDTIKTGFSLAISKPEDESIINTAKTTVSGATEPNTQVVIIAETNEYLLESDEKGIFAQEISLTSGTNEIVVTAFADTGEEISKTINVVYSTSEF
jgi:hypothetical protein